MPPSRRVQRVSTSMAADHFRTWTGVPMSRTIRTSIRSAIGLPLLAISLVAGIGIGLLLDASVLSHDAYTYRIQVQRDDDDIRFRYQSSTSDGRWATVKTYRASDPREGVWYTGRGQVPNYRPASSSGSSGSSRSSDSSTPTSSTVSVSGRGNDVKSIRIPSSGYWTFRATAQGNSTRYGDTNFSVWIKDTSGGQILLANDICSICSDAEVINVQSAGNYLVEVNAVGSWTVTATKN